MVGQIPWFYILGGSTLMARADECHLTPVIHVLQHPGCIPKPIPSFACTGVCTSYVQVLILVAVSLYSALFFRFPYCSFSLMFRYII